MTLKQARHLSTQTLIVLALTVFTLSLSAHAQDKPADEQPAPESKPINHCVAERDSPSENRTFYLTHVSEQQAANEIMVAIRNVICPGVKIYYVEAQQALVMQGPADQLALADKIIHDLDCTKKTYRVTYTLTELDAGKTVSTAHYSMLLGDGEHSSLKEGNKIPVATGSYSDGSTTANGIQTQFTYLDIGMNFDATIAVSGNSVHLKSKVEDSSLDQPVTIAGVTEPVVRQSVLDGTSLLTLDKPALLGTIDVPNSTRHNDIAVVVEEVK